MPPYPPPCCLPSRLRAPRMHGPRSGAALTARLPLPASRLCLRSLRLLALPPPPPHSSSSLHRHPRSPLPGGEGAAAPQRDPAALSPAARLGAVPGGPLILPGVTAGAAAPGLCLSLPLGCRCSPASRRAPRTRLVPPGGCAPHGWCSPQAARGTAPGSRLSFLVILFPSVPPKTTARSVSCQRSLLCSGTV